MNPDTTTHQLIEPKRAPRLPPRWFIRTAWVLHRAALKITGGRFGLRIATADRAGYLQLTTIGRRSGKERRCIVAYVEDGPGLITMAMNGWGEAEPAWWLNLQAHPDASVELPGGSQVVRARVADKDERSRLWAKFDGGPWGDLDGFAARRSRETAIVILERRN
jgi:deazaflavin-dependent oxidoreductase (nitroreductase family)